MADNQWTDGDVIDRLMDVRYIGIGGFPEIIPEDQWIAANVKIIGELGTEEYLKRLLSKLRDVMDDED